MSNKVIPANHAHEQLAVAENGVFSLSAIVEDTPLSKCPSTIDMMTDAGKSLMLKATGVADFTIDELDGQTFNLKHFLIHPSSTIDEETGEVSRFIRAVMIDSDGNTVSSTGVGVLRRLQAIVQLWPGRLPSGPITVRFIKRKSRRQGRVWHDMEVVPLVGQQGS